MNISVKTSLATGGQYLIALCYLILTNAVLAQPPQVDTRLYEIANAPSSNRIENDITKLVSFGTRSTLSDTTSSTRGIGAARRWLRAAFEEISGNCGNCLEVIEQRGLVKAEGNARFPKDTWVVNEMAIQRGTEFPNRYIIMSGDIDSRATDVLNDTIDAPGANDNASGIAGVLEAARILSQYKFPTSIIYVGLSGEEQGLFGGKIMAQNAKAQGWDIVGVLNNDMIGNIKGLDGVIDNSSFRVFSEPTPATDDLQKQTWRRFYGGEVDGPSRQLARYIDRLTEKYTTNLDAKMIYRLDRFGRGGHHRPFNDLGYAGVRLMETHEHYHRQHQDVRNEDGIAYGDVLSEVDFDYAAKLTGVNAITLASIAWAPPQPPAVRIAGVVEPSTYLEWDPVEAENLAGYKIYWRETTAPQWQWSRFVGPVTSFTLENIIIDNYLFGVASVGKDGNESVVVYPANLVRRGR